MHSEKDKDNIFINGPPSTDEIKEDKPSSNIALKNMKILGKKKLLEEKAQADLKKATRLQQNALVKVESEEYSKQGQESLSEVLGNMELTKLKVSISLSNEKTTKQALLENFKQFFFAPKNMTKKAMILTIQAFSNNVNGRIRYSVPLNTELEKLAAEIGVQPDQVLETIEAGLKFATMKEKEYNDNEESKKMLNLIDTTLENALDYHEKVPEVLKTNNKTIFYPFRFDVRFSYKLIAQMFFLKTGSRLPFGRTIPSRDYVYALGIMVDPNDTLELRLDKTGYLMRIGGLKMTQKFESSLSDDLFELSKYDDGLIKKGDGNDIQHIIGNNLNTLDRMMYWHDRLVSLSEEQLQIKEDLFNRKNDIIRDKSIPDRNNLIRDKINTMNSVLNEILVQKKSQISLRDTVESITGISLPSNFMPISSLEYA